MANGNPRAVWLYLLLAAVPSALILALAWFFRDALAVHAPALAAARDAIACLGILTGILAAVQFVTTERERAAKLVIEGKKIEMETKKIDYERTRLALELMFQFYEDERLEEVRRALRDRTSLQRSTGSLRYDEVRVMNFFEAVAIAVQEGCLNPSLVERMLGSPMTEVKVNPTMKCLLNHRFSYEAFQDLLPKIEAIRTSRRMHSGRGAGDAQNA
jgi:hypothetical protein